MDNRIGLSVKRMTRLQGESAVKAFCDVAICESFLIRSLKVVDGKRGLFVSMPRELAKNGQWYDTITPLTKEAKAELAQAVLQAYTGEPGLSA